MRRALWILVAWFVLGCKPAAPGVAGGSPQTLLDAAPPTVAAGWTVADFGSGFTMAFPPGWQVKGLEKSAIQAFVERQNENAWGVMEERKADVDLDTVRGIAGIREFFELGEAMEGHSATQTLVALREELGREIGLDEAADRWRDTLWGGSGQPVFKEAVVELPVGKAKTVSWASTTLGFIDKTTVYFLMDGQVQYTLFFVEEAKDADPIPVTEIMATFRVKR